MFDNLEDLSIILFLKDSFFTQNSPKINGNPPPSDYKNIVARLKIDMPIDLRTEKFNFILDKSKVLINELSREYSGVAGRVIRQVRQDKEFDHISKCDLAMVYPFLLAIA